MDIAISLGKTCPKEGQHPVGAVVTALQHFTDLDNGGRSLPYKVVVGTGVNLVHHESTSHAEVVALTDAENHVGRRRLGQVCGVLYTTHEPCPMCAGAITNSKLKGIVYGTNADDAQQLVTATGMKWRSNRVSGLDIIKGRAEVDVNEQFILGGIRREECLSLLALSQTVAPAESGYDTRSSHYLE